MAEGVIVLPVFIMTLAAIIYFHKVYAAKLERSTQARSCAWTYAVNGCVKVPAGCPMAKVKGFKPIGDTVSPEALAAAKKETDGTLDTISDVGLVLLQLDQGVTSTPSSSVERPSILGGGTATVYGDYTVMCNEKKMTLKSIAEDAYCGIDKKVKGVFPGCENR